MSRRTWWAIRLLSCHSWTSNRIDRQRERAHDHPRKNTQCRFRTLREGFIFSVIEFLHGHTQTLCSSSRSKSRSGEKAATASIVNRSGCRRVNAMAVSLFTAHALSRSRGGDHMLYLPFIGKKDSRSPRGTCTPATAQIMHSHLLARSGEDSGIRTRLNLIGLLESSMSHSQSRETALCTRKAWFCQ